MMDFGNQGASGATLGPEQLLAALEHLERNGQLDQAPPDLAALLRNVKKEKGQATEDVATEEIAPEPYFVVKTQDDSGRKVFINMCGHAKVAAPGNWQGGQVPEDVQKALDNVDNLSDSEAETLRFPLSMGQARSDLDKKGEPCTTFDFIFNSDVIKQASAFRPLKAFLIELAINWVSHKTKMQLDPKFKLPKMKYKGEEIEPQNIRVDKKPMVTEIREIPEDPTFPLVTKKVPAKDSTLEATAAAAAAAPGASSSSSSTAKSAPVPSSSNSKPAAAGSSSKAVASTSRSASSALPQLQPVVQYNGRPVASVSVTVEVPADSNAGSSGRNKDLDPSQIQVEICGQEVFIQIPGHQELKVRLPLAVEVQGSHVEWDGGAHRLQLQLPYRPLAQLMEEVRKENPFSFGQLQFVSDSYLELEP